MLKYYINMNVRISVMLLKKTHYTSIIPGIINQWGVHGTTDLENNIRNLIWVHRTGDELEKI